MSKDITAVAIDSVKESIREKLFPKRKPDIAKVSPKKPPIINPVEKPETK